MKKQTTTKIILGLIIFVFVVSIFQFALPIQAATDTSMANLYSNPNQSGNSTYKFKISDVVSSGLLTNVVGCTGVVNKVSTWMTKFIQSPAKQAAITADKLKKVRDQLKSACASTKAASETAGQSIPLIGGLAKPIDTIFAKLKFKLGGGEGDIQPCKDQVDQTNDEALAEAVKQTEQEAEANLKTQCFDGIAITLAKNQLTAMTRSMMNWVNSGYGGNPFFVQNMRNFTNNIERNVLETGIDILLAPGNQNPYASDFARSAITSRGLGSSSSNFLGTLQSDLGSFITDPKSYYTNGQLDQAMDTRDALERARDANYAFQNDFSVGGWNAYLALTQRDQNNPLGFTMLASQYLADTQMQQVSDARDELAQNNGFLSQKTCILWNMVDKETGKIIYDNNGEIKTTTNPQTQDECSDWKTITPGSIIKEKTTNYLNSPERQLELAKTINDSLNALFSVLISKLQGGGLSGLSDSATDAPMNWTDNMNEFTSPDGNTPYDNNGAYDGFNLTRDLGNTYIHATPIPILLGTWNAKTCLPGQEDSKNCNITDPADGTKPGKLYPDLAPGYYDAEDKFIPYGSNKYYTVITAGNTKLMVEGYNGWAEGDRAFWDGKEWQNWKKGQTNPIKKRGVIQIQQDYIVAAKEILGVLPNVMTNLGKLDYCIPGPNPSYKTNSTDAQSAYQDWVGSMYVGAWDNTGSRYGVRIDGAGERTYDNLQNIYANNSQVWSSIKNDVKSLYNMPYLISNFSNICNNKNRNCTGGYFYEGESLTKSENDNLADKTSLMNKILDYVNNKMFQDFYTTFDKAMNKLYFNDMVNMYDDTETRIGVDKNLSYIPMATTGLDLTKNITYYNDDVTKAMQDYTDAMTQAKVNIAKLEPIKTEVSGIILAAQKRRDDNRDKLLAQYKVTRAQYDQCATEENMSFYDADTITNGGTTENCTDSIDNDLNGLIDMADPACNTKVNNTGTATTFYYKLMSCEDKQTDPNDPYLTGSYQTYTTGPYPSGTYSSGDRVQGETNSFYVVVGGATYTDPISGITNIGTTSTGESSCPQPYSGSGGGSTTPSYNDSYKDTTTVDNSY